MTIEWGNQSRFGDWHRIVCIFFGHKPGHEQKLISLCGVGPFGIPNITTIVTCERCGSEGMVKIE